LVGEGFEEGGRYEVTANNMPVACCLARGQNPFLSECTPCGCRLKEIRCDQQKLTQCKRIPTLWCNEKDCATARIEFACNVWDDCI
jgi:hypothetical protein